MNERNEKIKAVLVAIGLIVICIAAAAWVFNQFFAKPKQDPVGTPNYEATQPIPEDELEDYRDDNAEGQPEDAFLPETVPNVNYVEADFDGLHISVGSNEPLNITEGPLPLNLNITFDGETQFKVLGYCDNGAFSIPNTMVTAEEVPDEAVLFSTSDSNSVYYKTSYSVDGGYFGWDEPYGGCESDIITLRIMGLYSNYFYGVYTVEVQRNEDGSYQFSSINKKELDADVVNKISSQLPEILSDTRYGVSFLTPEAKIYYDSPKNIYSEFITEPDGYSTLQWNELDSGEYPIYCAVVNFENNYGTCFVAYFNAQQYFIGYNVSTSTEEDATIEDDGPMVDENGNEIYEEPFEFPW